MIKLLERIKQLARIGLGAMVLVAASQAVAQGTQGTLFDHANTGFDLTGSHKFTACESCHVGGQFAGTPQTCVSCHSINGRINATPKPINHIYASEQCDSCHTEAVWNAVPRVDHDEVFGTCAGCHNTNIATGKPIDHIRSTDACESCHTNPVSWTPVRMDHDAVDGVDRCVECHNNFLTDGKPEHHMDALNDCVGCHQNNYVAWAPVPSQNVDHSLIPNVENCARCHNDGLAAGKPANHLNTTSQCAACHNPALDWQMATFDHDETDILENCAACHGGRPGIIGQSAGHIPTSNNCFACHMRPGISFFPVDYVDHDEIPSSPNNCASCHEDDRPEPPHVQAVECNFCHTDTNMWRPGLSM